MSSASVLSGFSRKLSAPTRTARTAVSMVACPLIMMTGVSFLQRAHPLEELDAVAVGEHHVEEAEVVGALLQLLLGHLHAAGDVDRVALEREGLLQRREDRGLVVDDEKVRERHVASVAARLAGRAGRRAPRRSVEPGSGRARDAPAPALARPRPTPARATARPRAARGTPAPAASAEMPPTRPRPDRGASRGPPARSSPRGV